MQLEKFKIKGWKKKEIGIVISENDEWILTQSITDYAIDGFKLYSKKHIKKRVALSEDDPLMIVLNHKKPNIGILKSFHFGSVLETLKWSERKYGLFEFQDDDQSELFYGKLNRSDDYYFVIDMIKTHGKIEIDYDYEFVLNKIRVITFETDYFNSIIILMNHELSKN